ncbi:MAG: hypothetical protein ABIQ66_09990 [Novosphingobium sp.]
MGLIATAATTAVSYVRHVAIFWGDLKLKIGDVTGLSPDALHIYVGLGLLLAASLILRRDPLKWQCWLTLLVLSMVNEGMDLMLDGMGSEEATLGAGLHDLVNTMIAPTMLMIGGWAARRPRNRKARSR